jgi:hypothetical protein
VVATDGEEERRYAEWDPQFYDVLETSHDEVPVDGKFDRDGPVRTRVVGRSRLLVGRFAVRASRYRDGRFGPDSNRVATPRSQSECGDDQECRVPSHGRG